MQVGYTPRFSFWVSCETLFQLFRERFSWLVGPYLFKGNSPSLYKCVDRFTVNRIHLGRKKDSHFPSLRRRLGFFVCFVKISVVRSWRLKQKNKFIGSLWDFGYSRNPYWWFLSRWWLPHSSSRQSAKGSRWYLSSHNNIADLMEIPESWQLVSDAFRIRTLHVCGTRCRGTR